MLYCPFISPLPLESLFRQMAQKWKEINVNQIGNPKDVMRTEFSTRLIYQYAEVIVDKVKLVKDFSQIIDSAYVLKQYQISSQNGKDAPILEQQFLGSITKLWLKIK